MYSSSFWKCCWQTVPHSQASLWGCPRCRELPCPASPLVTSVVNDRLRWEYKDQPSHFNLGQLGSIPHLHINRESHGDCISAWYFQSTKSCSLPFPGVTPRVSPQIVVHTNLCLRVCFLRKPQWPLQRQLCLSWTELWDVPLTEKREGPKEKNEVHGAYQLSLSNNVTSR